MITSSGVPTYTNLYENEYFATVREIREKQFEALGSQLSEQDEEEE